MSCLFLTSLLFLSTAKGSQKLRRRRSSSTSVLRALHSDFIAQRVLWAAEQGRSVGRKWWASKNETLGDLGAFQAPRKVSSSIAIAV